MAKKQEEGNIKISARFGKNNKRDSCDNCGTQSKVFLGYGPHNFCEKHFIEFFEKKVRKTIRMNQMAKKNEKIMVALSGGKDSTLALYFLKNLLKHTNPIKALIIDEGIPGYRKKAIKIAKQNCIDWKIPFEIASFEKEFGITNKKIMAKIKENGSLGTSCAFCGTLRRKIMNSHAKKWKADKIATGHNLDDEVQSIAMNFFGNDLKHFARLGAVSDIQSKDFVPRIKPLYESPEKEIILFCSFKKIKHYSGECCPFSWMAKRNEFRQMLNDFELNFPGTKYSILRFFQKTKPLLKKNRNIAAKISHCTECNEPCNGTKCMACTQIESLRGKSKKNTVKNQIKGKKCISCNELKELAT